MQGQRLIQSLLLISILTPKAALPFTLADMEVNSALNQKLDADIPIRLAPNEKPHDINVKMAEPIVFEEHKIKRHSLLDKIEFKRIGTAIQITSNSPINVPSLDFILQVNSRKGPTYQRYKITFNKNAVENKVTVHSIEASKLIPVAMNVDTKPVAIPLATIEDRLNKDDTFGPIQKTDSLTKIAKHIAKLEAIKTKTVLSALRHNNPNAFYKGTHGALKVGEFLHIPDFKEPKPAEVKAIQPTLILNTAVEPLKNPTPTPPTPIPTPINKVTSIAAAPLANDMTVQRLQTRIEKLEHHVEQVQMELAILQTRTPANPIPSITPRVTTETAPTLYLPVQVKPTSPAALISTKTNEIPNILNYPKLLIALSVTLLCVLTWLSIRFVKARGGMNKESSRNKEPTLKIDDLEPDLLNLRKTSDPVTPSILSASSNSSDEEYDNLEFNFLTSEADTTKIKKLKRSTRYPSDISDNLKK